MVVIVVVVAVVVVVVVVVVDNVNDDAAMVFVIGGSVNMTNPDEGGEPCFSVLGALMMRPASTRLRIYRRVAMTCILAFGCPGE